MKTKARGAHQHEYESIGALLGRVFGPDEADLWWYLIRHDPTFAPDQTVVAECDGEVRACTVVAPREVRTRAGVVPGAVITLVACDRAYRRRGLGAATVRGALELCAARGWGAAMLYGIPSYYPRFGFVPALPRLATELTVDRALAAAARPADGPDGELRELCEADLGAVCDLYEGSVADTLWSVRRTPDPWIWRFRGDYRRRILVLDAAGGDSVDAYARANRPPAASVLTVSEAAAPTDEAAAGLLRALARSAQSVGRSQLRLTLPFTARLARLALACGAVQTYQPPTSGMVAVVDWSAVLPQGWSVVDGRLARGGRPVLRADREHLVALAGGILDPAVLPSLAGARLEGDEADWAALRRDFAPAPARWAEAPYWG